MRSIAASPAFRCPMSRSIRGARPSSSATLMAPFAVDREVGLVELPRLQGPVAEHVGDEVAQVGDGLGFLVGRARAPPHRLDGPVQERDRADEPEGDVRVLDVVVRPRGGRRDGVEDLGGGEPPADQRALGRLDLRDGLTHVGVRPVRLPVGVGEDGHRGHDQDRGHQHDTGSDGVLVPRPLQPPKQRDPRPARRRVSGGGAAGGAGRTPAPAAREGAGRRTRGCGPPWRRPPARWSAARSPRPAPRRPRSVPHPPGRRSRPGAPFGRGRPSSSVPGDQVAQSAHHVHQVRRVLENLE